MSNWLFDWRWERGTPRQALEQLSQRLNHGTIAFYCAQLGEGYFGLFPIVDCMNVCGFMPALLPSIVELKKKAASVPVSG